MKLLVFAHTPPPVHGQSMMVRTMLDGLRGDPEFEIMHVNVRVSRDGGDIGSWRIGKLFALLGACGAAWRLRFTRGQAVFYYVPAPGKRSALYRDFLVMLLCRPLFPVLVLHWHAVGLGDWLQTGATALERWLARRLLGRAQLAIVLAPELAADAEALDPRRVVVVANSVPDPGLPAPRPHRATGAPCEVLFIGLCSRAKGLFDTLEAVALADAREPGGFRLLVAGGFAGTREETEFRLRANGLPPALVRHVGFADETLKRDLFTAADVVCFPTAYPNEGQPLVLIEALAHDVPIVTTRWRAIPSLLPDKHIRYVVPGHPDQVAEALIATRHAARPEGALRRHYLANFTVDRHLATLKSALLSLSG